MTNIKWWNLNLEAGESLSMQETFDKKFLSYGPIGKDLEQRFARHLNIKHTILTTSGSTSLLVALKAIGIQANDEVIVPNRTFQATANAVEFLGAKAKLADVDPVTGLMTASTLKKVLTPKTKAVIAVHLNGRAVDLDPIIELKKYFPFYLIEDTAQAFSSKYKGRYLGTLGDIGCFSLGVTKFITTGQGGFLTTNNSELFGVMKNYLFHGMSGSDDKIFNQSGFNFRQSDLLSSLAISQMDKISEKINAFITTYQIYSEALQKISCVKIIPSNLIAGEIPIWIEVISPDRDKIFNFLKAKEIESVKFYPSLHRSTHLKASELELFPNSLLFEEQGLLLPCGPHITREEIDRVTSALHEFERSN
jgi:perosamine synthetase